MATSTHLAEPCRLAHPRNLLAFWHLLSLDAPTVAALWTWFLARANHVHLPFISIAAMAIAVWALYALDRLLDSRLPDIHVPNARLANTRPPQTHSELEARHHFHRANHRIFATGILFAGILLAALLPHLPASSLRLYAVLGTLLAAYFALIHLPPNSIRSVRLPKELAVGIFFSAATFIPTIARQPSLRSTLLPAAILFGSLCTLNCLFIQAWEHPRLANRPRTRQTHHFLPASAIFTAGTFLALYDSPLPTQVPQACALSASLLLLLDTQRHQLHRTTLRAAADACLLTPILFLPFLTR